MVNEILLRAYTNGGLDHISKIAEIITNSTDLTVELVDHSNIDKIIFDLVPVILNSERWVSLDRHLANKVNCSYYRISRIFDLSGNIVGRHQEGKINHTGNEVRILDTDMVKGDTIKLAKEMFNTEHFTIPLIVKPNQDLIDVEDLYFSNSLFNDDGKTFNHNYLVNPLVFTKRTSLPLYLYEPIKELLYGKFNTNTDW